MSSRGAIPKRARLGEALGVLCAVAALTNAVDAAAQLSVDICIVEQNGAPVADCPSVVSAAPGDTLKAVLRLTADTAGISSYGISVRFDEDLADELDLISTQELTPFGHPFNITEGVESTQESTLSQPGHIHTYEAGAFGFGPEDRTYDIGHAVFQVTENVRDDGPDIETGLFNEGVDGVFHNDGSEPAGLSHGKIEVVPEPAELVLLLTSLGGLSVVARRRRSAGPENPVRISTHL